MCFQASRKASRSQLKGKAARGCDRHARSNTDPAKTFTEHVQFKEAYRPIPLDPWRMPVALKVMSAFVCNKLLYYYLPVGRGH